MKPKIISSKEIYKARIFDVYSAVVGERGKEYRREVIRHPGSAVIVPVFSDKTVGMVKQFRLAADRYLLELPAGTLDPGETAKEAAFREVEEEIGFQAKSMEKLSEFYVSPGFLDEKMYVFLATEMTESQQNLDEDEILSVVRITFDEAFAKIASGDIEDAKSMVGLILAGKRFGARF